MSTKPPKGIQSKKYVLPEESEVLWHLLSDLSEIADISVEQWSTFAFGLLGGVDVAQQSNLLRDRPVRIQVQTHRASFERFCQTLQLGFEEYTLNNQWTEEALVPFLEMTENIFYINRTGVWRLSLSDDGQTWWAQNRLGKSWNAASFKPKRGDRLWLIENLSSRNIQEVIHLVLAEQCAHFINSVGVEAQVKTWLNHIRRPSLRKSWYSILSEMTDYYWASVQLYNEIHTESDVAFREKYIQFLLQCAEYLHCPDLKAMALDFRRSQRYWKQLGTVLLDDASPCLRDVPVVDWMDSDVVFQQASEFAEEDFDQNLDSRLSLMETSVQRIVSAERRFFVMVSEVLSGLVRGRTLLQQLES